MVPKSSTPLDVNMMKGGNCKLLLFDVQCDDSGSNFYFSFAEKKEDFHWSLFTWCGVLCSGIYCVSGLLCVCAGVWSGPGLALALLSFFTPGEAGGSHNFTRVWETRKVK